MYEGEREARGACRMGGRKKARRRGEGRRGAIGDILEGGQSPGTEETKRFSISRLSQSEGRGGETAVGSKTIILIKLNSECT